MTNEARLNHTDEADEERWRSRALTPQEVAMLLANPFAILMRTTTSITRIAYWPLVPSESKAPDAP